MLDKIVTVLVGGFVLTASSYNGRVQVPACPDIGKDPARVFARLCTSLHGCLQAISTRPDIGMYLACEFVPIKPMLYRFRAM